MTVICKVFSVDALHDLLCKLINNPEEVFVKSSDLTINTAVRKTVTFFEHRDELLTFLDVLADERPDVEWHQIANFKKRAVRKGLSIIPLKPSQVSTYHVSELINKSLFKSSKEQFDHKDFSRAYSLFVPPNGVAPNKIIVDESPCITIYGDRGTGKTLFGLALKKVCNEPETNILCVDYTKGHLRDVIKRDGITQRAVSQKEHVFALTKTFLSKIEKSLDQWRQITNITSDEEIWKQATDFVETQPLHNIFHKIVSFSINCLKVKGVCIIVDEFIDDKTPNFDSVIELMKLPTLRGFPQNIKMVFLTPEIARAYVEGELVVGDQICADARTLSWLERNSVKLKRDSAISSSLILLIKRRIQVAYGQMIYELKPHIGREESANGINFSDLFDSSSPLGNTNSLVQDLGNDIDEELYDLLALYARVKHPFDSISPRIVIRFMNRVIETICDVDVYNKYLPIPNDKWPVIKRKLEDGLYGDLMDKTPAQNCKFDILSNNGQEVVFRFCGIPLEISSSQIRTTEILHYLIQNPGKRLSSENYSEVDRHKPVNFGHENVNFKQAKTVLKRDLNNALKGLNLGDRFVIETRPSEIWLPNSKEITEGKSALVKIKR